MPSSFLDQTGLTDVLTRIKNAFIRNTDVEAVSTLDIDSAPTSGSSNLVTSGGVYSAIPSVSGKEDTANKVTSISSNSTDTEYPSAKCVYDIVGDIETLINAL